jgi:hypothetical protein
LSKSAKPHGHTSKPVDHIAAKLMHSPKPEVRQVAAAALSDTRTSPRVHKPIAHTSTDVASVAASLMHTGNKQERTVAASVLADHKTNGGKK